MSEKTYTESQKQEIIAVFALYLLQNMHSIPQEFSKIIEDNFWDMV